MATCDLCNRSNLTDKELSIHKKYFHEQTSKLSQIATQQYQRMIVNKVCPDCGGTLFMEEGCKKCTCGYSEC